MIPRKYLALALSGLVVISGCATQPPVVENGVRFIPVELWTGADWDGTRQLRMQPVLVTGGKRATRTISGPITWQHPDTGEMLTVYERTKEKSSGEKRQLYALAKDRSGLGRVYDARPGKPVRRFSGDVIFPLGPWGRGEERTYDLVEYTEQGSAAFQATLKIRQLDFKFDGVAHSLKFDWKLLDAQGETVFYERYVYSPGIGLVSFKNRLK